MVIFFNINFFVIQEFHLFLNLLPIFGRPANENCCAEKKGKKQIVYIYLEYCHKTVFRIRDVLMHKLSSLFWQVTVCLVFSTLFWLGYLAEVCQAASYESVIGRVWGRKVKLAVEIVVVIYALFSCIAYQVIVGDQMEYGKIVSILIVKN